jgi:GTP-binding protein
MINLSKCQFVKSAPGPKDFLLDRKQVVFLGKSNVGKSTLINALTNQKKLAFVSKTPGRTSMLSYFDVDGKAYLVDAPGYGYYRDGALDFEPLMLSYLKVGKKVLVRAYLLIDARRGISEDDKEVCNLLVANAINVRFVATKADKAGQSEKALLNNQIKALLGDSHVIITSAEKNLGIDELRKDVIDNLR